MTAIPYPWYFELDYLYFILKFCKEMGETMIAIVSVLALPLAGLIVVWIYGSYIRFRQENRRLQLLVNAIRSGNGPC